MQAEWSPNTQVVSKLSDHECCKQGDILVVERFQVAAKSLEQAPLEKCLPRILLRMLSHDHVGNIMLDTMEEVLLSPAVEIPECNLQVHGDLCEVPSVQISIPASTTSMFIPLVKLLARAMMSITLSGLSA